MYLFRKPNYEYTITVTDDGKHIYYINDFFYAKNIEKSFAKIEKMFNKLKKKFSKRRNSNNIAVYHRFKHI